MAQAEYLALQHTVSILLHLLPDDKKKLAYAVIAEIKDQNYESNLLNIDPGVSEKAAKEFAEKMKSTYSDILKSARGLDENSHLSDAE
ncbi:hypothetical protein [Providencia heimbachae]|uniref:hypothetical protein n=1 Tax=Providencia heimbachae TaxID=333962 RepID=UPI0022402BC8|nr:hypothetical protein [Providencia heimbachae]